MSEKNYYIIEKNINKIYRGEPTNFLDPNTLKNVINKLKGINYNIYYPYKVVSGKKEGMNCLIKSYASFLYSYILL